MQFTQIKAAFGFGRPLKDAAALLLAVVAAGAGCWVLDGARILSGLAVAYGVAQFVGSAISSRAAATCFSGHLVPGPAGKFCAPIPYVQPIEDLPYLDAVCPRCGAPLKLYFLVGTRGTNTPAHAMAVIRWSERK